MFVLKRILPAIPDRTRSMSGIYNVPSSPNFSDRQRVHLNKKSNLPIVIKFILFVTLIFSSSVKAQDFSAKGNDFNKNIKPILQVYCYDCHGLKKTKGKVNLTDYKTWSDLEKNPELIEKLIGVLGKNEMPPEDNKQPSHAQFELLSDGFNKAFKNATAQSQTVVPVRLRRMNRFEYGNVVRDLFDLDSWVYSINDRIIRDHNNYFRPETGKMPDVAKVGNRIMGLQQMLENRLLGVQRTGSIIGGIISV